MFSLALVCICGSARANDGPDQQSLLQTKSRRMASTAKHSSAESEHSSAGWPTLLENVPYVIRWNDYSSTWKNAELGWSHGNLADINNLKSVGTEDGHMKAGVGFLAPTTWHLVKSGKYWRIRVASSTTSSIKGWSLSWDSPSSGCTDTSRSCYPMVSIEDNTGVDWDIVPSPKEGRFYIKNMYSKPGHHYDNWKGYAVSWDSPKSGEMSPMASLESVSNEKCPWEIIPVVTLKSYWQWFDSVSSCGGCSKSVSYGYGTEQSEEFSREDSFSTTVSQTVSAGVEIEIFSFGIEQSLEMSKSVATTVTKASSRSFSTDQTYTWPVSDDATNLWTFVTEVKNNQCIHKYQKAVVVKSDKVEATRSAGTEPKCWPGYCFHDTGCQICTEGGCLSESNCQIVKDECTRPDKTYCADKLELCKADATSVNFQWAQENCFASCHPEICQADAEADPVWHQLGSKSYYTAVTQGNDLGHPSGLSLEECQSLCEKTEGCRSVAHCPKHSKYCWMKDLQLQSNDDTKYQAYCTSYYMDKDSSR